MRRFSALARQVVLTVGAVVGAVAILVALGCAVLGWRPLVFQSGSMAPTIDTGALAFSHDVQAPDLRPGQVVSVRTDQGTRVTHRIVTATVHGGTATLALKGDANQDPDSSVYEVRDADVVMFSVPRLGYLVGWMSSPMALFALGLYAAFLLSVLVRRAPSDPEPPVEPPVEPPATPRRPVDAAARARRWRAVLTGAVGAGVAAACVVVPARTAPTLASWSDSVTVTGTSLGSGTWTAPPPAAPTGFTCTPGTGQKVLFTWNGTAGVSYEVHYGLNGASIATPNVTAAPYQYGPQNNTSGTAWVVAVVGTQRSAETVHIGYSANTCAAP